MVDVARLPAQLTSFVGRGAELTSLQQLVSENRLVTLTGAGGVGKTRLARQLADRLAGRFPDGAWWVDLAPITDPDLVADRVARALGLADQPGRSAAEALGDFIADRHLLLMLDNCEHLLDGCAPLIATLLDAGAGLQVVSTSREPVGVAGEMTWLTPSLSMADEAMDLFIQRARLVRPNFMLPGDDATTVAELCRRLDGLPLAIELAATRVRALSLTEIIDGLDERLQLLTGGARTTVPRQQTLRASVDWSHALLSEPEQVLFCRLAVFRGGFDLDAAHAVAADAESPRHQLIDHLAQLVDKSLVVVDSAGPTTRYSMLETVRQYALEKLIESGDSDTVRTRHRDHYTALFDSRASAGYRWRIEQAEIELDNLRAGFNWSREHDDIELATHLASALLPLWIHSRTQEGLAWLDTVLTGDDAPAAGARARALADKTIIAAWSGDYYHVDEAELAVAIARDLGDPELLGWALAAYGFTCCYSPDIVLPALQEAVELSPAMNDNWRLSQIFGVQAYSAFVVGDPATLHRAAEKGRDLADAVGDWSVRRLCLICIGFAHLLNGDLAKAAAHARGLEVETEAAQDPWFSSKRFLILAAALARQGDTTGARAAAEGSLAAAAHLIAYHRSVSLGELTEVFLAAGDVPAALAASTAAYDACALPQLMAIMCNPVARAALAAGDVTAARRRSDEALAVASGAHRPILLEIRARVALAEGAVDLARRDAVDALMIAAETGMDVATPDPIECLAMLATNSGDHRDAARLFGSAAGIRSRIGTVRYKIYDADHRTAVDTLREAMGENDFDREWAEGAALSTAQAIANACGGSGRTGGERKRPVSGWASLTPAEHNVALLVAQGLRDRDIAAKLWVSPRTVHTHLTHIYTKLGLSSRLQLAQEAARRG